MRKKPFKETKAYEIARKFLPGLARSVADAVPGGRLITGIIEEITGTGQKISPEELQVLRDYEKEMYAQEVIDRQSARTRETDFVKAAGHVDWMMYLVGAVGLASFAFVLYVMVYKTIPEENRDLFIHAIGMVEGVAISLFTYYFGSSKGSSIKNNWINK